VAPSVTASSTDAPKSLVLALLASTSRMLQFGQAELTAR
jgi:hypothetical protein